MGRRAITKMRILSFEVRGGVGVIAVEGRKGKSVFDLKYKIAADDIQAFEFERFKAQVRADILARKEDDRFNTLALNRVGDIMGVDIMLD